MEARLDDITVDFAVSEGNGKVMHYQVPLNYKARQAIVEAVEGLIGRNEKPSPTALRGQIWADARNDLRAELRQAIKEWQ